MAVGSVRAEGGLIRDCTVLSVVLSVSVCGCGSAAPAACRSSVVTGSPAQQGEGAYLRWITFAHEKEREGSCTCFSGKRSGMRTVTQRKRAAGRNRRFMETGNKLNKLHQIARKGPSDKDTAKPVAGHSETRCSFMVFIVNPRPYCLQSSPCCALCCSEGLGQSIPSRR